MVVKESFDSNVFIQDHGDLANRQSWVTSLMSGVGAGYQDSPEFRVLASYSPEVVFYHSESSEDHVAHCGTLNLGGNAGDTTWDVLNGIVWIDGNNLGPRFTGGGDIPAIGGIPVRDRRDAAIYRSSIRVTQTLGKFFLRPTFNSYLHDFQTEFHQTTEPGFAGYENYISRYDIGGGLDAGYEVAARTWLVLGYRYGHQEQSENQFGLSSPFCNNYHRFLVGIEGAPTGWLKLNMMAGPDVRDFTSATPAGFDPNELLYFVDASASITPTRQDTVTVKLTRYEQPAFSSHSMYEDIVYDVSYRRKFNDRLTAGVGFKVYGGDWQAPVNRDDWIYTPSAMLACNFTKHLTGDLAYSYDWVDSEVPGTITAGREFTRHIVSLGLKYAF
ncbi:MAG: hypothetical protein HZC54_14205 [Verrucomicrobia bacterium]|nr:hypothetical protein [Verrucomicrobiota bacterium]